MRPFELRDIIGLKITCLKCGEEAQTLRFPLPVPLEKPKHVCMKEKPGVPQVEGISLDSIFAIAEAIENAMKGQKFALSFLVSE